MAFHGSGIHASWAMSRSAWRRVWAYMISRSMRLGCGLQVQGPLVQHEGLLVTPVALRAGLRPDLATAVQKPNAPSPTATAGTRMPRCLRSREPRLPALGTLTVAILKQRATPYAHRIGHRSLPAYTAGRLSSVH
jgi:hypothetical protein